MSDIIRRYNRRKPPIKKIPDQEEWERKMLEDIENLTPEDIAEVVRSVGGIDAPLNLTLSELPEIPPWNVHDHIVGPSYEKRERGRLRWKVWVEKHPKDRPKFETWIEENYEPGEVPDDPSTWKIKIVEEKKLMDRLLIRRRPT